MWILLPKSGYVPVVIIVLVVLLIIIAVLVQRFFARSNKARKRQERLDRQASRGGLEGDWGWNCFI